MPQAGPRSWAGPSRWTWHWVHRLVRAEVDLTAGTIRFYRLRRREPGDQPLIREVRHRIKHKPFCE